MSMTIAEFATKHADECTCDVERVEHIQTHVDAIIEAAVAHKKVLWKVGVDPDGRVSLIWLSYDEDVWEALLSKAAQLQALKTLFGMK